MTYQGQLAQIYNEAMKVYSVKNKPTNFLEYSTQGIANETILGLLKTEIDGVKQKIEIENKRTYVMPNHRAEKDSLVYQLRDYENQKRIIELKIESAKQVKTVVKEETVKQDNKNLGLLALGGLLLLS